MARKSGLFDKNRSVLVSDGTHIAYTEMKGTRLPVVLANGWACNDVYWTDLAPYLAGRGHRVVLPDTRGHGESGLPRPPGWRARNISVADMSLERIAADLLEVCDDAGVDEAVFIGHSMGVQTILEAYREAPGRVLGLVAVAGPYENPLRTLYGEPYAHHLFPVAKFGIQLMPRLLMPAYQVLLSQDRIGHWGAVRMRAAGPKLTRERFAPYMAHLATRDPLVLFKALESMRDHSAADVLPEVDVPFLILAGEQDSFTPPAAQERMHGLAPNSELKWFAGAGHCLPIEEPDAVDEAIGEFLDKLEGVSDADAG